MNQNTQAFIAQRTRLGIWVFLASEIMFFGPVFLSYALGRYSFPFGFGQASQATDIALGSINTAVLLTSSLAMALAVEFSRTGATRAAHRALNITILLGLIFLAIKAREYMLDWKAGLIPGANFHLHGAIDQHAAELFYFIYFFSTLLHGVHLITGIGLVAICRVTSDRSERYKCRLEVTGLYWHFVDIVWIFLFPVLYLAGRST